MKHLEPPSATRAAGRLATWLLLAYLVGPTGLMAAESAKGDLKAVEQVTITDLDQVWNLPAEQKTHALPLRLEGRVGYYDSRYRMIWVEINGVATYFQTGETSLPLQTGQQVVIEGKLTPNKGLCAEDVTVRVLQADAPIVPLDTRGKINDLAKFHGHIVTTEGYVDGQRYVDPQHVRLTLIVENRPVICWVKADHPENAPDWRGSFVQVTGLYSRRFDPTQTNTTIEIWVERLGALQVLGTLRNNAQFNQPAPPISELYGIPSGTEVHVRGRLESHQPGKSMILRDETGLVEIHSIQEQRLPLGSEVEAVGRANFTSGQWVLEAALYQPAREVANKAKGAADMSGAPLTTVDQIRKLSPEEAAQSRPVELRGVAVWAVPGSDFFYLQDFTGGIRVYFDQTKFGSVRTGKFFQIKGVTQAGRFAPAIAAGDFTDLGSLSRPQAQPITLEQALTGKEEGQWVELRGFMQGFVAEGDMRWIHVTTPAGEFTGNFRNPMNFLANIGSLVRVRGVCETTTDTEGNISGITLRIPSVSEVTIEQDASADYYGLPRRLLGDLEQISASQDLLRVRVTGTVQHAIPGRLVYVEEDHKGLRLLTQKTQALRPGDRIEAVGILGREGARAILRETEYRKTGTAPLPEPLRIAEANRIEPTADSRLVRLRGLLIDSVVFEHLGQTRLTLQQGATFFEATLEQPAGAPRLTLPIGAGLEVTGIYQLKFDDARQARGFQLLLRSPDDVVVYMKPRLWTVQRALTVAGFLSGCVLLGLAWIRSLRRQVRRQTAQLRNQMEHQARLENEVHRAARLESLGVLAGGIAHDYNNLLTVILGNLSLMKGTPEIMALEGGRLEDIEKASLRARDLTRQLLTFAEGGEPMRAAADLSGLVREATDSILKGSNIDCSYEVEADLPPANVDRDQIIQVVQNLVRNAMEAMPTGGKLRVLLANVEVRTKLPAGLELGRYVRLTFIDTGVGIAPEVLPQIFDPYFSTKEAGGGLGLATAYSIVKKHQGHIEAQSKPGRGSSLTLWLPVAEAPVPPPQAERPLAPAAIPAVASPVPATAAPLRVLLMDDEESIRKLGTILLERMKLEVTAVADGASALREFEAAQKARRPFSLLVLDLTIMGGMGGKDVLGLIRKSQSTVPAIVSSGYSRDPVMAQFRAYGFQGVIAKPYDLKCFMDTVAGLLPKRLGME